MFYPVLYFVYAMTRGALSGVNPYPFINAVELGYGQALANTLGVLGRFKGDVF